MVSGCSIIPFSWLNNWNAGTQKAWKKFSGNQGWRRLDEHDHKAISKCSTFWVFSERVKKYKGQLIVTRKNWHLNQLSEERWHSEIHGQRRARSGVELLSGMVKRESIKQRLQFKDTKGWWGQGQKRHNRTSHAIDWKQFLWVASVLQPQPSSV